MRHTLRSRALKVFQVQLDKNNARSLLSRIFCIMNSCIDCGLRVVYAECMNIILLPLSHKSETFDLKVFEYCSLTVQIHGTK